MNVVKRRFLIWRSLHQGSYIRLIQNIGEGQKLFFHYRPENRQTEAERGGDLTLVECIMTVSLWILFCKSVGSQCSTALIFCTNWFLRQVHNTNTKYSRKTEIIFHYTTNDQGTEIINVHHFYILITTWTTIAIDPEFDPPKYRLSCCKCHATI